MNSQPMVLPISRFWGSPTMVQTPPRAVPTCTVHHQVSEEAAEIAEMAYAFTLKQGVVRNRTFTCGCEAVVDSVETIGNSNDYSGNGKCIKEC